MLYKDIGIVIKQIAYSDFDRILTIVTKNHGKISAIAKGARRLTSKKSASTDLFVKNKFAFAEGRNLDIVTETIILDTYEKSKNSFENIETLFYIAKVIDKLIEFGETIDSKEIYQALDESLTLLGNQSENIGKAKILVTAFEIKILTILGLLPSFHECVKCGNELAESENFRFTTNLGGIVCRNCYGSSKGNLSRDALKVLRFLSSNSLDQSIRLNVSDKVIREIEMVSKGLLEYFGELGER